MWISHKFERGTQSISWWTLIIIMCVSACSQSKMASSVPDDTRFENRQDKDRREAKGSPQEEPDLDLDRKPETTRIHLRKIGPNMFLRPFSLKGHETLEESRDRFVKIRWHSEPSPEHAFRMANGKPVYETFTPYQTIPHTLGYPRKYFLMTNDDLPLSKKLKSLPAGTEFFVTAGKGTRIKAAWFLVPTELSVIQAGSQGRPR